MVDNVLMNDTRCSPGITPPLLFIPPRQGDLPYSNVCKNLPGFRGRGVLAARWQSVNCVMVCLYEIGLLLRWKREGGEDGSQMQFSPRSHSNADHLNTANRVSADPAAFLLPHLHAKMFARELRAHTHSRCESAGKPACFRSFSLQHLIIFGIITRLRHTSMRRKYLFSTAA